MVKPSGMPSGPTCETGDDTIAIGDLVRVPGGGSGDCGSAVDLGIFMDQGRQAGPPHHQVLKDHLIRLLNLRDPGDRSLGFKTLHIGIVEDTEGSPERFFCASERMAVVPIPSLTSHEAFDSGVVLGRAPAMRLLDHGRQAYAAARRIETPEQVGALEVVRGRSARA